MILQHVFIVKHFSSSWICVTSDSRFIFSSAELVQVSNEEVKQEKEEIFKSKINLTLTSLKVYQSVCWLKKRHFNWPSLS